MAETVTVLTPGISSVQDLGRGSASQFGQATGGAADQISAEIANALVGSRREAPLLELTALDFSASASTDLLIAVTGAPATVTVDGHRQPQWEPIVWRAGQRLAVTGIHDGLRVYVAVHGELTADYLLGSCAPDQVLGFGRHLTAGETLVVDTDCPPIDHPVFRLPLFRLLPDRPSFGNVWTLDVTDGPDIDDFGESAAALFGTEFVVGDQSNHIGLRLAPVDQQPLPQRTSTGEVLSRGVPIGAVEVPAGNELLVLHRGRGVTAGYPVLAVVTTVSLSQLGQARPGHRVRFRNCNVATAVAEHREQQHRIALLRRRVENVFATLRIPLHTSEARVPSHVGTTRPASAPRRASILETA